MSTQENQLSEKGVAGGGLPGMVFIGAVVAVALVLAAPALGQGPPGRGGGWGDPMDFLRRLDTNGNGMIDPEEMEGRARFFVERLARDNPDLDLSRPIPLEKLAEGFTQMRERSSRERGSRDGGSRDGGSRDGGSRDGGAGDRSRSDSNDSASRDASNNSTTANIEPLVPGFGIELDLPPVPGFGETAQLYAVQITDSDRREAENVMRRYDRNKDGILDQDEARRVRWSDDPYVFDRNRDGLLSLEELAMRYAHRRLAKEQEAKGNSSRSAPSSEGGRSSGRRGSDSSTESAASGRSGRGDWGGGRRDRRGGGESQDARREERGRESQADQRGSYRFLSPVERLPKGLPDWFVQLDSDEDGQVTMAEFSSQWSDAVVAEFALFDLDGDGVITAQECLRAVRDGAKRSGGSQTVASSSGSGSSSSGFSSSGRSSGRGTSFGRRTSAPSGASSSASGGSESAEEPADDDMADDEMAEELADDDMGDEPAVAGIAGIDKTYVDYAAGLLEKYDDNGDGVLTVDEWSQIRRNPDAADANGDGRITLEELARFYMNMNKNR